MEFLRGITILALLMISLHSTHSQHEEIPYESIENICKRCLCLTAQEDSTKYKFHYILSCSGRNLKHILSGWPEEFGKNHTGTEIAVTFSENSIPLLQQIPQTNAILSFSCRHCGIKDIQSPTFVDVPNIVRLDLSRNYLFEDVLTPEVFRGPYNVHSYEPIALEELDISHNHFRTLDKKLFEHTPRLQKLNLAYNQFDVIDIPTHMALFSIPDLKSLDLSYNMLTEIPQDLFRMFKNLRELYLQGNFLTKVPVGLNAVGKSLKFLNLGSNPIKQIDEEDLSELKALTHLNISGMQELENINNGALLHQEKLKVLICNKNPKLERFDVTNLQNANELEVLDISNNNISTFFVFVSLPTETVPDIPTWGKLHLLEIEGNPWHCDCYLLKILEKYVNILYQRHSYARCATPYDLAGARIHDLSSEIICQTPVARKLRIPIHDPPAFLRPRSIVLSIISITVVMAIGIIVGFGIVLMKRKLKKTEMIFTTPIRYSIVRNSTGDC